MERDLRDGKVFLIGAGPGDPSLMTLKGAEVLGRADAILIDHLVNRDLLAFARPDAEVVDVGKSAGHHCLPQNEINRVLVHRALDGQVVARLKGGDPFVFGRGAEEAEALVEAGVEWEVVPGVTSGIAAAAYAGIPLLHRRFASTVAFMSGHEPVHLPTVTADTLVVFMCAATVVKISGELIARGRAPETPIALVRWGTWREQEVYRGTLADVAGLGDAPVPSPVIAIIGRVVLLADKLHWFGDAPRDVLDRTPARASMTSGARVRSTTGRVQGLVRGWWRDSLAYASSRRSPA